MATLLSVDTSAALCSLAIHVSGRWFEDTRNVERLHNQVVLAHLDALVSTAGVTRRGFEAVAFAAGPGSFTGVRIAAAVCQGIAFACDAVAVPVSSSAALAHASAHHPLIDGAVTRVVTVTRSRRDAYYLGGFGIGEDAPRRWLPDRLHLGDRPPLDLPDGEWVGVGNRPDWWPAERTFVEDVRVTAVTIGELALQALARGEGVAPGAALPIYVAGDSPWRPSGR